MHITKTIFTTMALGGTFASALGLGPIQPWVPGRRDDEHLRRAVPPAPVDAHGTPQLDRAGKKDEKHEKHNGAHRRAVPPAPVDAHGTPQLDRAGKKDEKHEKHDNNHKRAVPPAPVDAHGTPQLDRAGRKDEKHEKHNG